MMDCPIFAFVGGFGSTHLLSPRSSKKGAHSHGRENSDYLQTREPYGSQHQSHAAHKKFLADTEELFEMFAAKWKGPRRGLMEAFDGFRQALLAESGLKASSAPDATKSKRAA